MCQWAVLELLSHKHKQNYSAKGSSTATDVWVVCVCVCVAYYWLFKACVTLGKSILLYLYGEIYHHFIILYIKTLIYSIITQA